MFTVMVCGMYAAAGTALAAGQLLPYPPAHPGLDPMIELSGGTPHAEAFFSASGTQLYAASATSTDGVYDVLSLPPDVWGRSENPSMFPPGTYKVIDVTDGTTINIHNCFANDTFDICRHNTMGAAVVWTMTITPGPSPLVLGGLAALALIGIGGFFFAERREE